MSPVFTHANFSILRPLADGELLLSSTAIAGAAIGELLQVNLNNPKARVLAALRGGFTILFCTLCAIAYALTKAVDLADQVKPDQPPTPLAMGSTVREHTQLPDAIHSQDLTGPALGSLALFLLTIVTAGVCIRLAAKARVTS